MEPVATYTERERLRLSWRLRLGLGEPEELEEEEERELEEPERLEPDELDPLEEPELEPELLLEVELDLDLFVKQRKAHLRKHTSTNCNSDTELQRCYKTQSDNKPAGAAAASRRSTATFPYFLPSAILFSILDGLFFTSVFCFVLFFPLCR